MEIAGYPHYENVCSNILAFFIDPEESHGLGTLVLDALASAGDIASADEGVGGNVSVEREVSTDAGNRIDIMIESDAHAILVENKIYASANNPFDDYADYLDHRIHDGRAKHKLLLTIFFQRTKAAGGALQTSRTGSLSNKYARCWVATSLVQTLDT